MHLHLDTHAFLWFITDDSALSVEARSAIATVQKTIRRPQAR